MSSRRYAPALPYQLPRDRHPALLLLGAQLLEDANARILTHVPEPDEDNENYADDLRRYEAFVKLRSLFGSLYTESGGGEPVLLAELINRLGYTYLQTGRVEHLTGLDLSVKKRLKSMSEVVVVGSAPDALTFKEGIERFLKHTDDDTGSDWPIITRVRLFSRNWQLLRSGAQLVDAPGVGDANPIRNRIVSGYLEQAHQVWLMLDTNKWVSAGARILAKMCKMMKPVFHKLNANRSIEICLVMTKVETCWTSPDDLSYLRSQVKGLVSTAKNPQLRPPVNEDAMCSQSSPYPYALTTAFDTHVKTLDALIKQIGGAGGADRGEVLRSIVRDGLTAHATVVREKMVNLCRGKLSGLVIRKENIFVTSASDFKAMLRDDGVTRVWTKDQVEQTEIPALRRHIHESALKARQEQIAPIWEDIVRCARMLVLMTKQSKVLDGEIAQEAKSRLDKLFEDFQPKWESEVNLSVKYCAHELLSLLSPALDEGVTEASKKAFDCASTINFGHHSSWYTFCGSGGKIISRGIDFNGDLISPMLDKVSCLALAPLLNVR